MRDENLVKTVIAKGQEMKLLPLSETLKSWGYWVAIQIDPKTGKRSGIVSPPLNGARTGY